VTRPSIADAVAARLADLHALDARTHPVQWFEDDRVLEDARRLDAATGPPGALHGLPITVKDWIDVEGFPCAGTSTSLPDRRPADDATVVARMRAAGAVVLAKTKAWDGTTGGPPVEHPVDPTRAPGGSSSGDAVATAAGVAALGVGSDSGGSVRLPAAWCGVLGFKPTTGRLPGTGHFPRIGDRSDGRTTIGFLGSDVAVVERALTSAAGPDGVDGAVPPVPLESSTNTRARDLRVALLPRDARWPVVDSVAEACRSAVAALVEAGMTRVEWTWPWLSDGRDVTTGYWQRMGRSGTDAARQLWEWDRFRRRFLVASADVDILVSPVAADVAPRRTDIDARRNADGHVDLTDDFVFTLPASLTGSPALSVPMGHDADGLPLAVQLIGRPWEDASVLAAARALVRT
jgi:amidase